MTANKRRSSNGFTLIELLVVLGIVGLLLAAALPSFHQYQQTQRLTTAADHFLVALNLARSEAIQRRTRVDLAPLDNRDWHSGWIVFIKTADNSAPGFHPGDTILYSHAQLASDLRISARLTDSEAPYIAYNGNGRTRTNASVLSRQWGSWQFSLAGQVRLIRINLAGRARLCNPANDRTCQLVSNSDSNLD